MESDGPGEKKLFAGLGGISWSKAMERSSKRRLSSGLGSVEATLTGTDSVEWRGF